MLLSSVNLTREEKRDRHHSHNEKDCGYQGVQFVLNYDVNICTNFLQVNCRR